MKAVMIFPILKQESGNMVLSLNHRTQAGSLRMLSECFRYSSMRLGVPSIAPRQLGAVGDQLERQILPSVEWCTGQVL